MRGNHLTEGHTCGSETISGYTSIIKRFPKSEPYSLDRVACGLGTLCHM